MPGKFATPLLIVYASFQLMMPIGGHDILEGADYASRRPHLHLSMIDGILGFDAAGDCDEHLSALTTLGASAAEHDGDVVYLPSESSINGSQERMAVVQAVGVAWHAPHYLQIAPQSKDSSTLLRPSDVRAATSFLATIERWQI